MPIKYDKSKGVVFLIFLLILAVGSSYFLISRLSAAAIQAAQDEHDARVLAQAKEALIAYAVTYQETGGSTPPNPPNPGEHGFLPCPDIDETGAITEGGSHGTCGSRYENSIGRLPWKTLGITPLKDSAGECLWYAVSGQYKSSGSSSPDMLNADTNGTFETYASDGSTVIAGQQPDDRPVAVIFAPGESIKAQNRDNVSGADICGGNYVASNYLDEDSTAGIQNHALTNVADDTDSFILGTINRDPADYANQYVNDKIIYITRDDIWNAIQARNDFPSGPLYAEINEFFDLTDDYSDTDIDNLTQWVAGCLAKYGNDSSGNASDVYSLPFPASMDYTDYRPNTVYDDRSSDGTILAGRLPDVIDDSNAITGKTGDLISDCDLTTGAPHGLTVDSTDDNKKYQRMWEHWKDHFFYIVADLYQPGGADWSSCPTPPELPDPLAIPPCPVCGNGTRCIRLVDSAGNYLEDFSAMVIFSQDKLPALGQSRLAPPADVNDPADEKNATDNYLEAPTPALSGDNITEFNNYNNTAGDDSVKIYHYDPSTDFNDIIYCLNDNDFGNYHEIRRCQRSN